MCIFKQLGTFQVKGMNVYIEPLMGKLVNLWNGITMYDISRPMGQKEFQLHGIIVWTIHDAAGITYFMVCNVPWHFNISFYEDVMHVF